MVSKVTNCPWQPICAFDGWTEFHRFEDWMHEQIAEGVAEEVPVLEPYSQVGGLEEKWFKHVPSAQVWRLVWPEPPSAGLFDRVADPSCFHRS
jgi:hypothetical protein